MPPSVTQDAAREHDRLMEEALYALVGGARVGRNSPRWRVAVQQARLPVRMGGMGLTSAMDIREAAWVGTWALVTRPIRELHEPFRDLDVALAPGERFDELREAHNIGANVDFPKYFEKYARLARKEKFPEIYHTCVDANDTDA